MPRRKLEFRGFRAWLHAQEDRGDPVGDFAKDVARDVRSRRERGHVLFPAHPAWWSEVIDFLWSTGTRRDEVLEAAYEAWREYSVERDEHANMRARGLCA